MAKHVIYRGQCNVTSISLGYIWFILAPCMPVRANMVSWALPNSGPFGNIIATSTQHMKLDTEINS
jgi:hypothetical protein